MTREEQTIRREKMANAVLEGEAVNDVAREYRVSSRTVVSACNEHGVQLGLNRNRAVKSLVILKRLLDGEKQSSLAREYGVSRQAINCVAMSAREAGFAV